MYYTVGIRVLQIEWSNEPRHKSCWKLPVERIIRCMANLHRRANKYLTKLGGSTLLSPVIKTEETYTATEHSRNGDSGHNSLYPVRCKALPSGFLHFWPPHNFNYKNVRKPFDVKITTGEKSLQKYETFKSMNAISTAFIALLKCYPNTSN